LERTTTPAKKKKSRKPAALSLQLTNYFAKSSISFHSASLNVTFAAATFSSRCST